MKTILLIHGALGAATQFDTLLPYLSPHYNCILLDLPLHGINKDIVTPSIETYADYVIHCIEQNKHQSVSLFGYSMGGYIALLIAHRRPDLIEKVLTLATKFEWTHPSANKQLSMLNPTMMQEKIPSYTSYLNTLHHAIEWNEVVNNTYQIIEKLIAHPPIDHKLLSEIKIPCRLGVGDQDTMVTLQETMDAYKQLQLGSLYVLPSTPHPLEKVNPHLIAQQCINYF